MVEENPKSQRKEDDSNNDKKNEVSDTSKTSEFDKLMKGSSKPNNKNKLVFYKDGQNTNTISLF